VTYNYEHFDQCVEDGSEAREFAAFRGHLQVGEPAPGATVTRLADGQPERLSDRWRRRMVVLEFGSFT
jgi:hypothetical protein